MGALVVLGIASACAGPKRPAAAPPRAESDDDACSAPAHPVVDVDPALGAEPPWGIRISRVEVRTTRIPERLVKEQIHVHASDTLDPEPIRADVLRLLALEAVANVRIDVDGSVLRYFVSERPLIGDVKLSGIEASDTGRTVLPARGELYDPYRIDRARSDLGKSLVDGGHLLARVEAHQKRRADSIGICFEVAPGPAFVLERLDFSGNDNVADAELLALVRSHDGKVNRVGKPYRGDLLDDDMPWLNVYYFDRGFVALRIDEPQVHLDAKRGKVSVVVPISEGPQYRLSKVRFEGVPSGLIPSYERALEIHEGEIFARDRVATGLEKLRSLIRSQQVQHVDVETETRLDAQHATVELILSVKRTK